MKKFLTSTETPVAASAPVSSRIRPPATRWLLAAACAMSLISVGAKGQTLTVINTANDGPGSFRDILSQATAGSVINFSVGGSIQLESQLELNTGVHDQRCGRDARRGGSNHPFAADQRARQHRDDQRSHVRERRRRRRQRRELWLHRRRRRRRAGCGTSSRCGQYRAGRNGFSEQRRDGGATAGKATTTLRTQVLRVSRGPGPVAADWATAYPARARTTWRTDRSLFSRMRRGPAAPAVPSELLVENDGGGSRVRPPMTTGQNGTGGADNDGGGGGGGFAVDGNGGTAGTAVLAAAAAAAAPRRSTTTATPSRAGVATAALAAAAAAGQSNFILNPMADADTRGGLSGAGGGTGELNDDVGGGGNGAAAGGGGGGPRGGDLHRLCRNVDAAGRRFPSADRQRPHRRRGGQSARGRRQRGGIIPVLAWRGGGVRDYRRRDARFFAGACRDVYIGHHGDQCFGVVIDRSRRICKNG